VGNGYTIAGEASRIDVATAYVESLFSTSFNGQVFELVNQGKRLPLIDWQQLLLQISNT
jgi:hypothetical protein